MPSYAAVAPSFEPRGVATNRPVRSKPIPNAAPSQPQLRVISGVDPEAKRISWPLILAVFVLLVAALALPLVVNTMMAETAYAIRDQRIELAEQTAQTSTLEAQVLEASSPQSLEKKARALGLRPSGFVGALSLEEGTVTGGEPAK